MGRIWYPKGHGTRRLMPWLLVKVTVKKATICVQPNSVQHVSIGDEILHCSTSTRQKTLRDDMPVPGKFTAMECTPTHARALVDPARRTHG